MVKDEVLKILLNNENRVVSGADMANAIGVSRNAVWKAVKSLTLDGYQIDASKNCGYILRPNLVKLSEQEIKSYMHTSGDVFVFDEVPSTNDICKKMASDGLKHGSLVVANSQTNGRGRRGREFYSPQNTGIYMSVALRLNILPSDSSLVTTASAVAVCDAIEQVAGISAGIKWINDIYIDGRKCAGILTEGIFNLDDDGECVIIVGIGINVSTKEFPQSIRAIATSVGEVSRNKLIAKIVDNLVEITQNLENREHFTRYNEKCIVLNRRIKVIKNDGIFFATAKSVNNDGQLIVETDDGKLINLYNEEVSTVIE